MCIPKKYGQSRIDLCPFCKKDSTTKNKQEVPVCYSHKGSVLKDLTCFCGDCLELKVGRFGIYFSCTNCGNINLMKALEMNPELVDKPKIREKTMTNATNPAGKKSKKEITITSEEVDVKYS